VLPAFALHSYAEYGMYLVLGVLSGVVGLTFTRVLYALDDAADRLLRVPKAMRPAAGGLLLGCILFAVPQLYGVGYPVLQHAIDGRYLIGFLILLLVGKLLATSVTLAIGGSGGVFAPPLFMGAALGSAYGDVVHAALPSFAGPAGAYGIVGMAAVFAAATRAPVTAIVIVFELTNDYRIILPLMLTVVVATGLSSILSRDTIYTLKLRRRGIDLHAPPRRSRMMTSKVREAMRMPPAPIASQASLDEVAATFADNAAFDALPVVDDDGSLRGVVSRSELERSLTQDVHQATALDLAVPETPLAPGDTLEHALECLASAGTSLPVLDPAAGLIGWLGDQDVFRVYLRRTPATVRRWPRQRLEAVGSQAGRPAPPAAARAPAGRDAGRRASPEPRSVVAILQRCRESPRPSGLTAATDSWMQHGGAWHGAPIRS
jgi:chloride channel protein, CIC family